MKTLTLNLNIRFSEGIETDEDINIVGENVRQAIAHAIDTAGISPDESGSYVESFSITCPFNDLEINHTV